MVRDKVAVLEENPGELASLLRVLLNQGLADDVTLLRDGQEALAYFHARAAWSGRRERERPAVFVIDLGGTPRPGLAVVQTIRADADLSLLPVVAIGTSNDPATVRRAYQEGANSYIVRPQTTVELSSLIGLLVDYWLRCNIPAWES